MSRRRRPLALALVLTAAVVLSSCSQADSPTVGQPTGAPGRTNPENSPANSSPTTSFPTSSAPSTSAGRRIDITVKGSQVTPKPGMVNIAVGESLTISVTSDHDDELHAHGFEIEQDIKAGQRLEVTVKGAKPGVYEVELHEPELRILQVAVR